MAEANTSGLYVAQEQRSVIGAAIAGVFVGLAGWMLNLALQAWIIEPFFCRSPETFAVCSNGGTVAWTAAVIFASIIGLIALVRSGVFRPLLVVIATLIALWGVAAWLGPLVWWQALLWHGILFAVAYSLFSWIARISSFLVALIITIVVIVLARLVVINS